MIRASGGMLIACVVLFCGSLGADSLWEEDVSFIARRDYEVGLLPASVVVADFNGDEVPDLAVARSTGDPGAVIIFLGKGNGRFESAQTLMVGTNPRSITVGDFNGDAIPDLAVTSAGFCCPYPPGTVSILIGHGDGTFGPAKNFGVGEAPSALMAGDFNNDEILDLAVVNRGSGTVSILQGEGDGRFRLSQTITAGGNPSALAVGDFNEDKILDLAVPMFGPSSGVAVFLGNGDLTFQRARLFSTGTNSISIAVGDFNGDAILDLAVGNTNSYATPSTLSILIGYGDGTFGPAENLTVGTWPRSIEVGDFNGDAISDLAVANGNSHDLSILLGRGDGTFQLARNIDVGNTPEAVAIGDFDGDAILDLAVTNGHYNVSILSGCGDGTFRSAHSFGVAADTLAITAGDFDGDKVPDLAVGHGPALSGQVAVLIGNGDGTFRSLQDLAVGRSPDALAVGDFNGDAIADLAVSSMDYVSIFLGHGDGTFSPSVGFEELRWPRAVTVGDFNGDAIPDLAMAHGLSDGSLRSLSSFLGNGDGTFKLAQTLSVATDPSSITVGDFNGDAIADLAVVAKSGICCPWPPGTLSILIGHGDGTFDLPENMEIGSNPTSLAAGDFNGDAILDLAVTNAGSCCPYPGTVSILIGHGDGTFGPPEIFGVGSHPRSLAIGDFNADAILDLAVSNHDAANISILLGRGNGTFAPAQNFGVGPGPGSITVADFDGDNGPDLAVINHRVNNISILINDSPTKQRTPQ